MPKTFSYRIIEKTEPDPENRVDRNRRTGMPIYVFRCSKCKNQFEKSMTVAEREKARPVCPKCKGRKVEPVLTGFSAKTSRKS